MSNLSDLLPAGASAKQITATDSGSGIASKAPVIMNASGTVTQVGTVTQAVGSPVVFEAADIGSGQGDVSIACDTSNNKIVIAYTDVGNSMHGTAIVGTVSDTGISYGTAVVFNNQTTSYSSICFDSSNNKMVIAYRDGGASNHGKAIVGTVSGTSISFGTAVTFESANSDNISATFDTNSNKVVIAYGDDGNSSYGTAIVGTVSGTSISFGSPTVYESANSKQNSAIFDSSNNKVVIAYRDFGNSGYGTSVVGTVSGTGISFGSPVVYASANGSYISATFDSSNNKVVITYQDGSQHGNAIVGTVSGTSISFGTGVVYEAAVTNYGVVVFNSDANKVAISYSDNGNNDYGTMIVGTVSGTSISFGSPVVFAGSGTALYLGTGFDSTSNRVVTAYQDGNNSNYGTSVVLRLAGTNVNATNFVGVADSAISASAAGSIIVQGGTVTGVEVDPAVTTGSQVVFDDGGATTRISSAFDPDNNKIVHAFCTSKTHAIVGTVSGTSVTYGTAVQINTNASDYTSTAYDTANDRVVIVYSDNGDSYGYASVGTVSGTSITFGTKVVFSTASSNQKSVVYDANAGKVLIVYRDGGGGDEVKGIVGTVDPSDNSISFGSPATAAATQNFNLAAVYDSNAQKTVVVAQDYTDSTGTAYVATITGTSVSFGTGVDFLAAAVNNNALSVTFNSTDNKVIVGYGKASDNKGYLITGTVSGTSIGFAGETAFSSGTTTNYISLAYKAAGNILGIVYNVSGSSKIRFNNAVISGTSFSFGTEQDLVATTTDTTALILDETANNFVASYGDGSNNFDGTTNVISVSTSAVIGTKYYVTTSGGFSSSADTPSVNAGLAISTTSLLLNGDS